jgi:hypothetical protein
MSDEVRSAFYWRENMENARPAPVGTRKRSELERESLRSRIRELRDEGGTYQSIGDALGVTKEYVRKLLNGTS